MTESKPPKVFISYAWEEDTKNWTREFAARLRSDGVDTILDQWHVIPGDSLPEFMEKSVSESDFVLVICTPAYKRKSESEHPSGVVYEKGVITGELFVKRNQRKFIPILQKGKWGNAAPSWILAKTYIDLSDDPYSKNNYMDLLRTLYSEREFAPPLGSKPDFSKPATKQKKRIKPVFVKKNSHHLKKTNIFVETIKTNVQKTVFGIVLIGFASLVVFGLPSLFSQTESAPEPTKTAEIIPSKITLDQPSETFTPLVPSKTSVPTRTPTNTTVPTLTPTKTSTPTPTPLPDAFSDIDPAGNPVSMRLVPEGEFIMGSNADDALAECKKNRDDQYCDINWFTNEEPPHIVDIDSFYIDQYEVTNTLYKACVEASVCKAPNEIASYTRPNYYWEPQFNNYPVINVDWFQAKAYCEWRGADLPSEAQWEKAARGTDARIYPWGDGISCGKVNYDGCAGDTKAVDSYESGKSPYGIYNMSGNVWEWVDDWYSAYPGNTTIDSRYGIDKVKRGGSFGIVGDYSLSSFRLSFFPDHDGSNTGFRCARDVTP
ncbi:MAG: hypothetical protein DRI32_08420 [Chloroflexi bacterium]|nr:MAG: hypothetical protein DRI32_08420 [Chloroflexota bacterium]